MKTLRFLAYYMSDAKGSESLFAMLNGGGNVAGEEHAPCYLVDIQQ